MFGEEIRPLVERLSSDLPKGCCFFIHHLSAPPVKTNPIFGTIPGKYEEETYEERHFLSVSIEYKDRLLQVFAIEVYIYTTDRLTTIFVSKADSTGYVYLLGLPEKTPSPFRSICTTFLGFLVEERSRPGRRLVISLFARSQSQYLFPGSAENDCKHVLDDRALIKWWCKVVHPLLGERWEQTMDGEKGLAFTHDYTGYLRVPGCETHETRGLLPTTGSGPISRDKCWTIGDPLRELAPAPMLPERCLVPRFPDDPKARFAIDLDDELPELKITTPPPTGADGQPLPPVASTGRWKSVTSLNQFWEAMSFRQECAAGRLVGFVWAVFVPRDLYNGSISCERGMSYMPMGQGSESMDLPEKTKYYFWPPSSRGEIVLLPKDYKHVGNFLLELDYGTLEDALKSSQAVIDRVASKAGIRNWGSMVVGQKKPAAPQARATSPAARMLNMNLVRRKRLRVDTTSDLWSNPISSTGVMREDAVSKKAKLDDSVKDDSGPKP